MWLPVTPASVLILVAGVFSVMASSLSFYLIFKHQANMTWVAVQSKVCAILWIVPIYATTSWVALLVPSAGLYLDLFRDCYESYVLYIFLSLMLSYLNADLEYDTVAAMDSPATDLGLGLGHMGNHTGASGYQQLAEYLERKRPPPRLPFPFSALPCGDLPKGAKFLQWCKVGTLQYCVVRPLTTVAAVVLNLLGLYRESNFSPKYGFVYLTTLVNVSIAFAFVVLVTFYTSLKKKLAPFSPVGKFLCIKAVIFATFWQAVALAVAVKVGWIRGFDSYSAGNVARSLQDALVCVEMLAVAGAVVRRKAVRASVSLCVHLRPSPIVHRCTHTVAHLYTFSYVPFTVEGQRARLMQAVEALMTDDGDLRGRKSRSRSQSQSPRDGAYGAGFGGAGTGGGEEKSGDGDEELATGAAAWLRGRPDGQSGGPAAPPTAARSSVAQFLERHFAGRSAVRDFNASMPLVVLPSDFVPGKGVVVDSRPGDRVPALEPLDPRSDDAVADLM